MQEVKIRILDWAAPHFPLEVREAAVKAYMACIEGRSTAELDCFASQLSFGTGGLRGILGWGAGRMNRWTVGRVTTGLCILLKERMPSPSLAVAFDSRRRSAQFARETAGIAAGLGLKVYLFREVAPTPILSYAVRKLRASAGVMITASHNPPEYNGYKVYGSDGSQLVGNIQSDLEQSIEALTDWGSIPFLEETDYRYREQVKMVGPELRSSYFEELSKVAFANTAGKKEKSAIQVIYSPLHGTGGDYLPALLRQNGFSVTVVAEQEKPDGEFPTVALPNPEEPSAMRMAAELAKQKQADIFIATDPDADRLGAGVRTSSGEYLYLNGNQIGSLMCAFLCERLPKERSPKERYHIFKTIVTTNLQREIGRAHGVEVHDLLTGFKYISEQMRLLEQERPEERFLFGGEESFGYLAVDIVRDKDSLSAALLLCEMLAEVGDLSEYLDQISLRYGLYQEGLRSAAFKGPDGAAQMNAVMDRLRSREQQEELQGWQLGSRQVTAILDYQQQLRNGRPAAEIFGKLPPSNVLQLLLEPEGLLTVRPSGTEPKVKLYSSLRWPKHPGDKAELKQAQAASKQELELVSSAFFERSGLAAAN